MATIEQLYKDFGVLADAKDKAGEHETAYLSILSAVKGGANEKRLASQFIARFCKYFPSLAEKALDAQFDLCEDVDINIRKQAIKDLPSLGKSCLEHLPRIADVLTQLLQTEDSGELSLVQISLATLLKADPKGALGGLFSQILQGDDFVRERAIKFLQAKLPLVENMDKTTEDFILQESKRVLQDVTGGEFVTFMKILSSLNYMQTMMGRQQLIEIITDQADLDLPFEASDPDCVDKLIQCARQATPFFSKNVHSVKFAVYMCDQVLPVLSDVVSHSTEATDTEKEGSHDIQLDLLKLFAELSLHAGPLPDPQQKLAKVFDLLLGYMPLPVSEDNVDDAEGSDQPKIQFSYVECLMSAFHSLGASYPEFLTDEGNAERLKDFRLRLQYLARGVQVYIKQLRVALQEKTGEDLKSEENKIKVVALKTTNNINTLIKDLFHNPPSYKASITLSWQPATSQKSNQYSDNSAGLKRPGITPITFESDGSAPKKSTKVSADRGPKKDRSIYTPPSGKFSEKAGTFQGQEGWGRGRGRGRGRGGRGRGWGGGGRGRLYRQW